MRTAQNSKQTKKKKNTVQQVRNEDGVKIIIMILILIILKHRHENYEWEGGGVKQTAG